MTHSKHVRQIVESITPHTEGLHNQDTAFDYNDRTGFLQDEQNRLLLFRAEQSGAAGISRRAVEVAAGDAQQVYGRGVYFGNTPESVAPYTWLRDNTAIHAYVTSPLEEESIEALPFLNNREAITEIANLVRIRRRIGATALIDQIDTSYGDAAFVARDMGYDIKTGQHLSSTGDHLLPPRWGILRHPINTIEQVGTATTLSQPRPWALALAKRAKARHSANPSVPASHDRR